MVSIRWEDFSISEEEDDLDAKSVVLYNNLYQVSIHDLGRDWWHMCVVRRDRSSPRDWRDLQRIKNEIMGEEREAVEVYPRESRLVDTMNASHLWVAPAGVSWPVGYIQREVSDRVEGVNKQRPFLKTPKGFGEGEMSLDAPIMVPPSPPVGLRKKPSSEEGTSTAIFKKIMSFMEDKNK